MDQPNTSIVAITAGEDPAAVALLNSLRQFVKQFGIYFTIIVILSGIFGNLLSLAVFWRLRRQNNVTVFYLFPIAFYDLAILCNAFNGKLDELSWAISNGAFFIPESLSDGHCKFWAFVHFGCGMMSGWTLIVFCVERCIAIRAPLKVSTIFTPLRRGVLLVIVVLFSTMGGILPIPCYFLVPSESFNGGDACMPVPSTNWQFSLMLTASTLYSILPVFVLMILNALLLQGLFKSRESIANEKQGNKETKTGKKILLNVFLVSLVYIISMFPVSTVAVISFTGDAAGWPRTSKTTIQFIRELFSFTSAFHYTNYSTNYIVYVLSLDFYRLECKKIFCCSR
jgi:hypothetical protein